MKIHLASCVLTALAVSATIVAGEADNGLIRPEDEKSVSAVFPDEMKSIIDEVKSSGLGLKAARQVVALTRKCGTKIAEKGAVNKPNAEACRTVWVIAVRFVRDTNDEDARTEISDAWNATFSTGDTRQALLQLAALGDIWEKQLISKALLAYIDKHAAKNTRLLYALGYAVYKSGDEDSLSYLNELQRNTSDIRVRESIQKVLNRNEYKRAGHQGTPGPAEAPPKRVDLSELDDMQIECPPDAPQAMRGVGARSKQESAK
jgi:uncharacterized protein (UPF0335 family)